MDSQRFDDLARRLASGTSRRGLIKGGLVAGLVGGALGLRGAGSVGAATPCTSGRQCSSRRCVDGFCCNAACTGQCEACNVPGREGTCSPVTGTPVGNRQRCPGAGVCQAACDGVTRTRCAAFPGPETVCGASTCIGGWQTTYACGGNGTCHPTTTSCGLYVCSAAGTACLTTCASSADCVGAAFCANGVCQGDKPLGQGCTSNDQCQSGLCVDGACCDQACTGPCEACNLPGNVGFCSPIAGCCRTDGDCDDNDACTTDSCGADNRCTRTPIACDDGRGLCTTKRCDPATGCVFQEVGCDDGNACTADSCDPQTGCVHDAAARDGQPCDNGTGTCQGGQCVRACPPGTSACTDQSGNLTGCCVDGQESCLLEEGCCPNARTCLFVRPEGTANTCCPEGYSCVQSNSCSGDCCCPEEGTWRCVGHPECRQPFCERA